MINEFPNPDALANALADYVANALESRLSRDGVAALAVSGGTTPVKFFHCLSRKCLNWRSIIITLVDDRWVPETSSRSNAALVKQHLLQGPASDATFLSLVNGASTPDAGRANADAAVGGLPLPLAAVVLGMGTDGHTASFFPGGDTLAECLTPTHGQLVEAISAEAAGEPRITLTLPILLEAGHVALHIEGQAKRAALEAAWRSGPVENMPIRAILARDPPPDIFWSP